MAKKPDTGLSDKDLKKLEKNIKETKDFIKAIEALGGEVPKGLTKALNRFETALNTGKDIAKSAQEASEALRDYEKDLMDACKTVDQDQQMVCEAGVARQYQARSVKFTLDPKNKDGVISKSIQKTVKRYTPGLICKHWDYCAKEAKKKKK